MKYISNKVLTYFQNEMVKKYFQYTISPITFCDCQYKFLAITKIIEDKIIKYLLQNTLQLKLSKRSSANRSLSIFNNCGVTIVYRCANNQKVFAPCLFMSESIPRQPDQSRIFISCDYYF